MRIALHGQEIRQTVVGCGILQKDTHTARVPYHTGHGARAAELQPCIDSFDRMVHAVIQFEIFIHGHAVEEHIVNLKGREQRELADDHPLKQIYEKRLNTINRYVKRGTLDADLAEVMKKLAKDKMLRALSNVAYAKGDYKKEMEQATLKKEAKRNFEFAEDIVGEHWVPLTQEL